LWLSFLTPVFPGLFSLPDDKLVFLCCNGEGRFPPGFAPGWGELLCANST
jgi:hypothetical protein